MQKLRVILVIILIVCAIVPAMARTAAEFFISAPDNVITLIPQSRRYDMIDYFRYGSSKGISNLFDGESRVTAESSSVIDLEISERTSMQIAVLAAPKDTVIAVITTIFVPIADSTIAFYDRSWRLLKHQPASTPDYEHWIASDGRKNIDDMTGILPFILSSAQFNLDATVLTFTNNSVEYLGKDEFAEVKDRLVPSIVYDVVGTKLKLRK